MKENHELLGKQRREIEGRKEMVALKNSRCIEYC